MRCMFLEDDEEDGFYIEDSILGFSVNEVLNLTQYDGQMLSRKMKNKLIEQQKKTK